MPNDIWPEWEQLLAAAAHLQRILPGAILVGGSASARYAEHRLSTSADHILTDLRQRFNQVLAEPGSVAGWKTARAERPVQILSSLDGIETGVRQLLLDEPPETMQIEYLGEKLTVPTESEILRINGVQTLRRTATRDYLDLVALAEHLGAEKMVEALRPFDHLYPQPNEESALQQMQIQLADSLPHDLEELNLAEYDNLDPRWSDWRMVKAACADNATLLFDRIVGLDD